MDSVIEWFERIIFNEGVACLNSECICLIMTIIVFKVLTDEVLIDIIDLRFWSNAAFDLFSGKLLLACQLRYPLLRIDIV